MDYNYLNTSINLGDDFAKFAAGNWIKYHPQPKDYPSWDVFDVLGEENLLKIKSIIDNLDPSNKMQRKMLDYWYLMTDYDRRNSLGFKPLAPFIEKIHSMNDKKEILKFTVNDMVSSFGIDVGIGPDEKNSTMNEVIISQDLILGNKEYYLSDKQENKDIIKKWVEVAVKVLVECGFTKERAEDIMDTVLDFEKELAESCYSVEELDKPELNYHMFTVDELSEYVKYDMREYLAWDKMPNTEKVIVSQPEAVAKFFDLINRMTIVETKYMCIFNVISDYCFALSEKFGEINFEFTQFMTGAKERREKWKRQLDQMDNMFSEEIGYIYSYKYFSSDAKSKMEDMIENIKESYHNIISSQHWMSSETKKIALDKLDSMTYKVGYPDKWKDYSDIPVDLEKTYVENVIEISRYFRQKSIDERYNKPVDRTEWPMSPHTVNACYMPTQNEFCFPAAILQKPFFDIDGDDASNYGAIGVIIGHEITHGFDTAGRLYTKDGNIEDWWSDNDAENFDKQTENIYKRFDSLYVLPGLKCNAELTLNENIADFGGLNIAFNALKTVGYREGLKGTYLQYDWKQMFFISYAQIWAGRDTEEIIRKQTMNNSHSINYMRVNGTCPMMDEWYDAFSEVNEDNSLYVKPEERGTIWRQDVV